MMDAVKTNSCPCCGAGIEDISQTLIDSDTGIIVRNGHFAALPIKEFELFEALWGNRGRVMSKQAIMEAMYWQVSDDEEPEIKIVDVVICKIRKKLDPLNIEIVTAWGRGYRIIEKEVNTYA